MPRSTPLLAVLASLAAIVLGPAPSAIADEETPPTTLLAGHALVAETDHSSLGNGWYSLDVYSGTAQLWETIPVAGAHGSDSSSQSTWQATDLKGLFDAEHDHTQLRLRRNGDLVLSTARGRQLWHSGTKGSGAVRLTLHRNGRLALHAKSGKIVWSSRTGQVQMSGGMTLDSGKRLSSYVAVGYGSTTITLTMQRNGNLVHRCGSRVDWQTHTHVRGSSLRMYRNGALRVLSPKGRIVWSAHSGGGHHDYAYLDSSHMTIQADGIELIWYAMTKSTDCAD